MSNSSVGQVYDAIIKDVIDAIRGDFEDNSVGEAVLQELAEGWRQKLSGLGVAAFPWDPKPEAPQPVAAPAPAAVPPSVQPSNGGYTQSQLSPTPNPQAIPLTAAPIHQPLNGNAGLKPEPVIKNEPGPVIKQEPGVANGQLPPQHQPFQQIAAQRAAQALQNQFGQRAAASIGAIQTGMQASQMNPGQQPPRPGQPQAIPNQQQYRQGVAAAMAAQQQRNIPNGLPTSQMDGATDGYEAVLMQHDANGHVVEMGRVEIDELIHAKITARAKQMEGGGLMLPLREATKTRGVSSRKRGTGAVSQVDGNDDDLDDDLKGDIDDRDAINSDLDDSDDQQDDEDDEEESGQMMLCMYDKVQRVKNKWKCTLKDGVLNVNGREYVFHKATGEYEW